MHVNAWDWSHSRSIPYAIILLQMQLSRTSILKLSRNGSAIKTAACLLQKGTGIYVPSSARQWLNGCHSMPISVGKCLKLQAPNAASRDVFLAKNFPRSAELRHSSGVSRRSIQALCCYIKEI